MASAARANEAFEAKQGATDAGVRQAEETISRFKRAADDASEQFREAYSRGADECRTLGLKSVEMSRANLNAHLDFLTGLLDAKSAAQAMELQSGYLSRQLGIYAEQAKQLATLAQDVAMSGARQAQEAASRGFRDMRS